MVIKNTYNFSEISWYSPFTWYFNSEFNFLNKSHKFFVNPIIKKWFRSCEVNLRHFPVSLWIYNFSSKPAHGRGNNYGVVSEWASEKQASERDTINLHKWYSLVLIGEEITLFIRPCKRLVPQSLSRQMRKFT